MTIYQVDLTLTLICVIVSTWVLSIIWQTCYKWYKICFLDTFYRLNEKTAKIWCFALTSSLCIIFTDCLSKWTYPFIIKYFNIIKTFHLINSKNILGKFYAKTAPCLLTMHLLLLLKISLRIFFKCSINSALFPASDAVLNFQNKPFLYKRLLFLQVHSQVWDNWNWQLATENPLKMMKNFTLKTLFVLKIIKILPWLFRRVEKRLD